MIRLIPFRLQHSFSLWSRRSIIPLIHIDIISPLLLLLLFLLATILQSLLLFFFHLPRHQSCTLVELNRLLSHGVITTQTHGWVEDRIIVDELSHILGQLHSF